jgi:hypothetical protein
MRTLDGQWLGAYLFTLNFVDQPLSTTVHWWFPGEALPTLSHHTQPKTHHFDTHLNIHTMIRALRLPLFVFLLSATAFAQPVPQPIYQYFRQLANAFNEPAPQAVAQRLADPCTLIIFGSNGSMLSHSTITPAEFSQSFQATLDAHDRYQYRSKVLSSRQEGDKVIVMLEVSERLTRGEQTYRKNSVQNITLVGTEGNWKAERIVISQN